MLSSVVALSPVAYSGAALAANARATAPAMSITPDFSEKPWVGSTAIGDKEGLKALAADLNPVIGYWDPLNIGDSQPENIAWFRQAEVKHGRVAMAAFVGFLVQSNGIHWPGNLQQPLGAINANIPTISYADISAAGGPGDQWDALPDGAKIQILGFIGALELWSEASVVLENNGEKHYVRGGKIGYFPPLKGAIPHPVPFDLFDPFGLTKKLTPEQKEKKLLAELNNGRLAMLGIIGLVSASKGLIVPGLDTLPIAPYSGEYMAPFSSVNSGLPFVSDMLQSSFPWN